MNKLPDKPSELLMVAMEDLEKCENDPSYKIEMSEWVDCRDLVCEVCHAGAVIVHTLKVRGSNNGELISPSDFDEDTEVKLLAIDNIREGYVRNFLTFMGCNIPDSLNFETSYDWFSENKNLHYYSKSKDPKKFEIYKNWIVSFIGILQAEGL